MDRKYRVAAYVDLQAVRHNLQQMKAGLPEETRLLAVVKADAYGHGAVEVAKAVEDMVAFFAVATADEAMELRDSGIDRPILILGYTHESYYEELIRREIRPCVYTLAQAQAMSACAVRMGRKMRIHLKVDTGMGRLGFQVDEVGMAEAAKAASLPGIEAEGLFTHFATADEADKSMTYRQIEKYEIFDRALKERGVYCPIHHIDNSAGILDLPGEGRQMARAGIAMYGCYPSSEVDKTRVDLHTVLSLKSHIVHLKWLEPGSAISYGATYVTKEARYIATIPVGYGDGYPRSLSGRGYVLIRGQKAPICGRVCMDQMMVDVTEIQDVALGDEVTLIGSDGVEEITATALGEMSGRFNYELLCDLNQRVPRIYL